MRQNHIEIGDVKGSWTVIGSCIGTGHQRRWLCRCCCGTERYVLERSLIYGYSRSCGCRRADTSADATDADLIGKHFGDLEVIGKVEARDRRYSPKWLCRCACGNVLEVVQNRLISGRIANCGCKEKQVYRDVTGMQFGRLQALYPLQDRDARGSKLWHCRCECGTELDVSYNTLLYSNTRSCGCKKKENDHALGKTIEHVAGTSINHIRSKKVPANNTSGVRGICRDRRGKYIARIVFQKKQYWLGAYRTLEEAAQARKEAEQVINEQVVDFYAAWKKQADADAAWAKENPIRIQIEKKEGRVQVMLLPKLD